MLRRYYRYLYCNQYIIIPLAERLPKVSIQGRKKFPTIWNHNQIQKIKEAADRTSPSGKRSFAMIMLSAELGLRIGDIRNLKLQDIDWNKKQIFIIQHKTDKELLLPLPDDVGWAIIDYLRNGRPYTDSPNVFVKHKPPYDAFTINSTMNHIFSTVMNKVGIPPEMKEHTGWHTFRRSLATNLLQNNIEISTISEILGHSDPDIAGRYYVKLNIENLKKCALSMEVKDYVRK
jgi:integrase